MKIPVDCDRVLLVPENHYMAKLNGQKITVCVLVEKYAEEPMMFDPKVIMGNVPEFKQDIDDIRYNLNVYKWWWR